MSESGGPIDLLCAGNRAMCCGALIGALEITDPQDLQHRPYLVGAGYPITPVNEVADFGMRYFERLGATFIQAESELASGNMLIGAATLGVPAFTATSSPGMSLMQEAISYATAMELGGLVYGNVVRASPGLGTIQGAQSDLYQAVLGGGHGDYRLIVLAPSSVQEMFDFTRRAFALSAKYRIPAMILADGYLGQTTERFSFDGVLHKGVTLKQRTDPRTSFYPSEGVMTTHNWKMARQFEQVKQDAALRRDAIEYYPAEEDSPADLLLIAYGSYARCARGVVDRARSRGLSVALATLKVLSPFPGEALREAAAKHRAFVVIEGSLGQLRDLVVKETGPRLRVASAAYPAGALPKEEKVFEALKRIHKGLTPEYDRAKQMAEEGCALITRLDPHPESFEREKYDILAPDDLTTDLEAGKKVKKREPSSKVMTDVGYGFCPGCSDATIMTSLGKVLSEVAERRPLLYAPVGCTVGIYDHFDPQYVDGVQVPHGRGPAAAAASKRARPDRPIVVVQGDGDAMTIGGNELLHVAERGDPITLIILNNGLFGMTGGQVSATTPVGGYSSTTPGGREAERHGQPLDLFQLVNHPGVAYFRRALVSDRPGIEDFENSLRNALAHQMSGDGLSIIEVLCACPSRQKFEIKDASGKKPGAPRVARAYSEQVLAKVFPLDRKRGEDFEDPLEKIRKAGQSAPESGEDNRDRWLAQCTDFMREQYAFSPGQDSLFEDPLTFYFCGRGGQGIQIAATVLSRASADLFPGTTLVPWYAPEVRNAATSATVRLSRHPGENPYVQPGEADALLCMEQSMLESKLHLLKPNGVLVFDSSQCKVETAEHQKNWHGIPATTLSREKYGSPRYANMILLGFLLRVLGVASMETVSEAVRALCPNPEQNLAALEEVPNGTGCRIG